MKLDELDSIAGSDQGAVLTLKHPATGEPMDAWIKSAGPDSKIAKQRQSVMRRKLRQAGKQSIDFDEIEGMAMDSRVAKTLDWGNIELEGKPVAFSEDNARMLYTRFPWIAEQVDEHQADRSFFIAAASKPQKSGSGSGRG